MQVDLRLVGAARELLDRRFRPDEWAGAAAMYTESGRILTSVAVESPNAGAGLCIETGAIAEAHKLDEAVAATVCLAREAGSARVFVLAPCGICQERLRFWGPQVSVAVADGADPTRWRVVRLGDLQPYWWATVYGEP